LRGGKIPKYGLEARVLELEGQYNHTQIAEILTQELADRIPPIKDSISQSTVSRHLKEVRAMRAETAREMWKDAVEPTIKGSCNRINQIEDDSFARYQAAQSDKERILWAREVRETVKLKFSYAGLQEGDEEKVKKVQKAIEQELGKELMGKLEDVVGTTKGAAAVH